MQKTITFKLQNGFLNLVAGIALIPVYILFLVGILYAVLLLGALYMIGIALDAIWGSARKARKGYARLYGAVRASVIQKLPQALRRRP